MKKFLHVLQGSPEITKGNTLKAEILGREDASILLQLENGMFATIDYGNVFIKCGPNIWPRFIVAKKKGEKTRVKITHITCDGQIKVVPWGRYRDYKPTAKDISDKLRLIDEIELGISAAYQELKSLENMVPYIKDDIRSIEKTLAVTKKKKDKKDLSSELERLNDSIGYIETLENFIKDSVSTIFDVKENILGKYDLLFSAS